MTFLFILSSLLTLSLSMLLMPSPLSLGLTILFTALLVACSYATTLTSWFAFLIYLIYVGGVLVMFSYFLALTPNQPSMINSFMGPVLSSFILFICTLSFIYPYMHYPTFHSSQSEVMFMEENSSLLIILTLLLLLAMVIVVKVSCRSKGPLRAFMSYV